MLRAEPAGGPPRLEARGLIDPSMRMELSHDARAMRADAQPWCCALFLKEELVSSVQFGEHLMRLQARLAKNGFFFGHLFFNITNVFCAKKRVGHACICPRMVTS